MCWACAITIDNDCTYRRTTRAFEYLSSKPFTVTCNNLKHLDSVDFCCILHTKP